MNQVRQTKTNTIWLDLHVESKKKQTKNRLVAARGSKWWLGEMGEGGQKAQTSSYK